MSKIKCPNVDCNSVEFYLYNQAKPVVVDETGNIKSDAEYNYKCCLCGASFRSKIGPQSTDPRMLRS
jgi:hypothetical protein